MVVQELSQSFAPDAHPAVGVVVQAGGEFAHAPPGEGQAGPGGAGPGRRHDEGFVVGADQAGTASRPVRVQRRQAAVDEVVDHVGVRVGGDQLGDRRRGCPGYSKSAAGPALLFQGEAPVLALIATVKAGKIASVR